MHGYFVDNKLYQRAKSVANPSLYEDYKKEQARKKQKEKTEKRITLNTKKPAVNADLAERWQRDGKVRFYLSIFHPHPHHLLFFTPAFLLLTRQFPRPSILSFSSSHLISFHF